MPISWFIQISSFLILVLTDFSLAAQYEINFGRTLTNESYWDGLLLGSNRVISLLNTDGNNSTSLLLSRHNLATGNVLGSTNIFLNDRQLEGRSLGLGRGRLGFRRIWFVTGRIRSQPPSLQSGAFILRTANGGIPTHFLLRPANPGYPRSEEGINVENHRLNLFVAGNSRPLLLTGNDTTYFWATRLNANMHVQWSYRYFLTSSTWNDFTIREGCLGMHQSNTGSLNQGLAMTGYYGLINQLGRHTFITMINTNGGNEVWRRACPSEWEIDEGLDIVYSPATRRYFIVGYAQRQDGVRRLYTAVVRNDGMFLGSAIHDITPDSTFRNMAARAVCLSLSHDRAVVTGYLEVFEGGVYVPRTFIAEMTIQPNPTIIWAYYYQESSPDATARSSESIQPVPQSGHITSGYLVTTGGQLSNTTSRDAQFIKITPLGNVTNNCRNLRIMLTPRIQQSLAPLFQFTRDRFPWLNVQLPLHQQVDLRNTSCRE